MKINMIWSTDPNGYIGHNNQLLFRSKLDVQHFKSITTGSGNNAVVMGRKTFDSLGKPLSNRLNLILTKNKEYLLPVRNLTEEQLFNCSVEHSIYSVLKTCKEHNIEELWVIGGKEIYQQFLELSETLIITNFDNYYSGVADTQYLPNLTDFETIKNTHFKDGTLTFTITLWKRKQ